MKRFAICAFFCFFALPAEAQDIWQGKIIDAHSQVDHFVDLSAIPGYLEQAGVSKVILAARGKVSPEDIAALARNHPDKVVASVRTKGNAYTKNAPHYYTLLKKQLGMPEFKAMAEINLWHAQKGNKAPLQEVAASGPQAQAAINAAINKGWPVVLHYEFRGAGERKTALMAELESVLKEHPNHPFLLTHMGQVDLSDAERLIAAYPNIHFITSWSNTLAINTSGQPWTNLFDGKGFADGWRALMSAHPDRFVLGFDNVFEGHWSSFYGKQVRFWRKALATLPGDAANKIAHGNAERLWRLN